MRAQVLKAEVTESCISAAEHEELVAQPDAGAVVGFSGIVRNHDDGREVLSLDYSAHPSAQEVMTTVVTKAAKQAQGVRAVAVSHRVGALRVGDTAFVVAVAAEHRAVAFSLCALIVDEVKAQLPVWKHQKFADGTQEWVGSA
ncbi:MAG: molybdenum cofactor biosynthesis protein MoaE [Mycobacteriaceae bacterium]